MATRDRKIRLADEAYELLRLEAARRGVDPDVRAESLLRDELTQAIGRIRRRARATCELRGRLPEIDGLGLAREARAELDARQLVAVVVDANLLVVLALDRAKAGAVEERLGAWRAAGESLHAVAAAL